MRLRRDADMPCRLRFFEMLPLMLDAAAAAADYAKMPLTLYLFA